MRVALLTGLAAAALSFAGAGGAQADIIYDAYVAAPGYVYSVPAPVPAPSYVVPAPGYTVVAEPPAVVVAPPQPAVVAPSTGIVTTGYSTGYGCYIDFRGIERCY